jgi:predicted RNA polymerase sigma factor
VVRDHAGRLAASLVHLVGDFAAAEDLVQDAIEAALSHWPAEGIPDQPDAWLEAVVADARAGAPWRAELGIRQPSPPLQGQHQQHVPCRLPGRRGER